MEGFCNDTINCLAKGQAFGALPDSKGGSGTAPTFEDARWVRRRLTWSASQRLRRAHGGNGTASEGLRREGNGTASEGLGRAREGDRSQGEVLKRGGGGERANRLQVGELVSCLAFPRKLELGLRRHYVLVDVVESFCGNRRRVAEILPLGFVKRAQKHSCHALREG